MVYTSLIIIVLSFVVGAFQGTPSSSRTGSDPAEVQSKDPVAPSPAPVQRESIQHREARPLLGTFDLTGLFRTPSEVDESRGFALAHFIHNHDIDLEIVVAAREGIEGALSRAAALSEFLFVQGISPEHAFVWADSATLDHTTITVVRTEPDRP